MKKIIFAILAFIAFNCNATVSILFVNGITTNKVGAQNNLIALAYRYCITYKKDCSDVKFRYLYNRTDGFFDDSGELRIQSQADTKAISDANNKIKEKLPSKYKPNPFDYAIGSDEHNLFMAYIKTYLSNIYFEKQLISSGVMYDTNTFYLDPDNANSTVAGVFRSIAVEVLNELSLDGNTRRVVIVPHSQGNYFAQAVQALVASKLPDSANRLRVQGVASVSSIAQLAGEHTSHATDQALFAHTTESLFNFSRKPNFEAGWKLGTTSDKDDYLNAHPDDKTNHGMLEVYMGMKKIQLPLDGYNCSDIVIPTEEYSKFVETYKLRSGRRCQKDTEVSNGTVLIGVGNNFPDLRGTQLPLHIINKVFNSIPIDYSKTTSCPPVGTTLPKPNIVGQSGQYFLAKAGQQIKMTIDAASQTSYTFGSYKWTTSDKAATLVSNGGITADFILNTPGVTSVTITPVLVNGTVCNTASATLIINVDQIATTIPTSCSSPVKSVIFSENFTGALDNQKWQVISPDGILSGGGVAHVTNVGAKFPFAQSAENQIPSIGNFSIYCQGSFNNLGGNFAAICAATKNSLTSNPDITNGDIAMMSGSGFIWYAGNGIDLYTVVRNGVSLYGADSWSYITPQRTYETCYVDNKITVYENGINRLTYTMTSADFRPTKVWFGLPPSGIGPWNNAGPWNGFDVNSIEVRSLQ